MLVDQFDELWEARPFQPFRMHLADGRSVQVKSPEFAWHAPAHRVVWVASGVREGRVHMVDLHLVTQLTLDHKGRSNGNGKKRRGS